MLHNSIFSILAIMVSIYSLLCTIRIILTWIPGISYSVSSFFSKLCDPYLNLFGKCKFLRFGSINFSPILSLGVLAACSTIFTSLSKVGHISFASILALIISMSWNVISSILNFFLIILIIRFIVLLVQKNSYNGSQFWRQLDSTLNPFIYKIISPLSKGKMIPYKNAILLCILILLLTNLVGSILISILKSYILLIPF